MSTYSLEGLADFILQLYDEEREEDLWDTWLHKDQKDDFKTFKKKYFKQAHRNKPKALSKEEEERNIANAMRFIKPTNTGGENE